MHSGLKLMESELRSEWVCEQANQCAQQSLKAKRAVRSKRVSAWCKRTSKQTSEWPSTFCVFSLIIRLTVQWLQSGTGWKEWSFVIAFARGKWKWKKRLNAPVTQTPFSRLTKYWQFHQGSTGFLDAFTHLYKRVCPSVRMSDCPSIRNSSFIKTAENGDSWPENHRQLLLWNLFTNGTKFF